MILFGCPVDYFHSFGNCSTCFMVLRRFKPPKLLGIYNVEKYLYNLNNRLHNNANEKVGYTTGNSSVRKRGQALRMRLTQNIRQTRAKVEKIIERENIWTIPNFLCVGRIITTPCLTYLIVCSHDFHAALWIFGLAGLTDFVDGWIARTWSSQASKLGSFLDPMADKLLVGSLFLSLSSVDLIPVPLTCLVVLRDVGLIAAASYIRYRSLPSPKTLTRYFDPSHATVQLAPTFTSKLNTAVQLSLVAGTLAAPVFHFVNHPILEGLCYLTAITTIAGGISYLTSKQTYKFLSRNRRSGKSQSPS